MVPYMKKNHMAMGQNFLPLVNISFNAANTESFSEEDSVTGFGLFRLHVLYSGESLVRGVVHDEEPAQDRDDDGDDGEDDVGHVDAEALEHDHHGRGRGQRTDVTDQEQHTAHGGELALPEPHCQHLHDGDVDHRGTDSDYELGDDKQGEVLDAVHCGHGPEDGTDGDECDEYRRALLWPEGIREDTAGDLHYSVCI